MIINNVEQTPESPCYTRPPHKNTCAHAYQGKFLFVNFFNLFQLCSFKQAETTKSCEMKEGRMKEG